MQLVLQYEVSPQDLRKAIWEELKKKNIEEKLHFFSQISSSKLKIDYSNIRKIVKNIFDLRNRLAHYKDYKFLIAEHVLIEEIATIIRTPPIPEINTEVMWSKAKVHAHGVLSVIRWFTEFIKYFNKKHNIKTRNKNIL